MLFCVQPFGKIEEHTYILNLLTERITVFPLSNASAFI